MALTVLYVPDWRGRDLALPSSDCPPVTEALAGHSWDHHRAICMVLL